MRESLQDSIRRLLRYQRVPATMTRLFREWKHDADILPRVQAQLEMLLGAYGKFEPVVYNTQGMHDDGADVVIRFRAENGDGDWELIGFQVKSFGDLANPKYMRELKAQRDDAFRKVVGMRDYFLILCTDGDADGDKVRNIMAEFRSAQQTEVIEPAYSYTFLHHPKTRVEAIVKRAFESGDIVFTCARELLEFPSPSARALAIFMTVKSVLAGQPRFSVEQLLGEQVLRAIYVELRDQQLAALEQYEAEYMQGHEGRSPRGQYDADEPPPQIDEFEDQFSKDLALLEDDVVEFGSLSGPVLLRMDRLRALSAIVTDALARYEHDEFQLMEYMFSLMRVRD